jgi:SNF2 family DNA or RNA helicase
MPVKVELDPSSKKIVIDAPWRLKEVCRALPGSKWSQENQVWTIPLSWTGCLSLRSTFKEDLEIGPVLAEWARNERISRIDPSNSLRDVEVLEDGDQDLFPHQRAGVEFLSKARRALLADEPGLGKTAQAIRSLKRLYDRGEQVFPALIVCPNTLKSNWQREFDKWWPGIDVQIIKGSALQRRKVFEHEAQVYVINWESLRGHSKLSGYGSIALARCLDCGGHDSRVTEARCEAHPRELNAIGFKSVIADEIHRSKDPKSKQTRALWAASGHADIRYALTGTPIANNVIDLWPILHWLDETEWPTRTKWIDRYVNTMVNAFGGMLVLGLKPEMEQEFYAGINPRMRRMLKARVLPWLPEVINSRRDVEMGAKQEKAYNQMLENMITLLEKDGSTDSSGDVVVAPNPLTQTLRLVQFASAYAEIEVSETGEESIKLSDPSCKVDALMDDIKNGDYEGDQVAVCAVSRQLIELLSARMVKEDIKHGLITGAQSELERQQAIDNFQSGKIKWILFTAQAGGVGVTLTAARRLVMLQRPWSLVDYKQALDRVHRIGSEIHDSILITDYVTEGTIEERVIEALDVKADNFDQIVKDRAKLLDMLKNGR